MGRVKVSLAPLIVLLLLYLLGLYSYTKPANTITEQTLTIVQGHPATLQASSANAVAFQWLKNDSAINGATQSKYIVSTAGKYQVLTTNAASCASELSDPVMVTVVPVLMSADLMIGITASAPSINLNTPLTYTITVKNAGPATATQINIQSYLPGNLQFDQLRQPEVGNAAYNNSNKKVSWIIDELKNGQVAVLTFIVEATGAGAINTIATVSANQLDPDHSNNIAKNTVTATTGGLTVPNTFTPNGDGINDVFFIPGLERYPDNEFTVINRWGSTVYEKKGYQNDWNGSGLSDGTYFYLLKVRSAQFPWQVYKGYITLLRAFKR